MNESLPTIELALLLGLRHGLAPDHLAAIDGLTMRARPAAAPWMGALFAIGHGVIVLLIVALADLASGWLQLDSAFLNAMDLLEWLPGVLLLALAVLNARGLLRPMQQAPRNSLGARLMAPLTNVRPLTALGIGMLFALGVESVLQALAWGYASAQLAGDGWSALHVAGAFVLGMAITDALDGYATARISAGAGQHAIQQFRRRIGWPIVALCSVSGAQLLMSKACASCALASDGLRMLGMAMVATTMALYAYTWVQTKRTPAVLES
jgi:high-affinity nickel-transport protein